MLLMNGLKKYIVKVEEALDKLKVSLRTLKDFKAAFQKYKGLLPSYFKDKETKKSWDFQVGVLLKMLILLYPFIILGNSSFQ